jgi:hypothetical protein
LGNNVTMRHLLVALLFALLGASSCAQATGDPVATAPRAAAASVVSVDKLVLFSRPVFAFRGNLMGWRRLTAPSEPTPASMTSWN